MASSSSDLEGFHAFITGAAGVVGSHIIQEFLGTSHRAFRTRVTNKHIHVEDLKDVSLGNGHVSPSTLTDINSHRFGLLRDFA